MCFQNDKSFKSLFNHGSLTVPCMDLYAKGASSILTQEKY